MVYCLQIEGLRSTCNLTDAILMGKDIELLLLRKDVQEKLESLSAIEVRDLPVTANKVVEFVAGTIDFGYLHDFDRPLLSKMRPRRPNIFDVHDAVYNTSVCVQLETSNTETQTDSYVTKPEKSETSSDTSINESGDDSSDESDESESESEEINKSTVVDCAVQTELNYQDRTLTKEQHTMTDLILLEEKAISTRSQGLQNAVSNAILGSDSADDATDNSLAARRRRRRERAQTAYIVQDVPDNSASADAEQVTVDRNFTGMSGLSLLERRKLRSTYAVNRNSVDGEDVFFDAMASKNL